MSHPLHVHHLRPGRHLPSLPAGLHTHGPPLGCQLCWIGSCIIPQPLSAPFLPSAAALSSLMHFFFQRIYCAYFCLLLITFMPTYGQPWFGFSPSHRTHLQYMLFKTSVLLYPLHPSFTFKTMMVPSTFKKHIYFFTSLRKKLICLTGNKVQHQLLVSLCSDSKLVEMIKNIC